MTDASREIREPGTYHRPGRTEESRVFEELTGLRKEVYEARNLVIRTDNLLKNLQLELKNVGKKQEESERRHFVGHVAAYVVIGVIAIAGGLGIAHYATSATRSQADEMLEEAKAAQERAEQAQERATSLLEGRDRAAQKALNAYQMMSSSDSAEQSKGLQLVTEIDTQALDPLARSLLSDVERSLRVALANELYEVGMAESQRGSVSRGRMKLEEFLGHLEHLPGDWGPEKRAMASYYAGAAHNQAGNHERAVARLETFLATNQQGDKAAYAYLLLGDSLSALGRKDEARKVFSKGLSAGGDSRIRSSIERRLEDLQS